MKALIRTTLIVASIIFVNIAQAQVSKCAKVKKIKRHVFNYNDTPSKIRLKKEKAVQIVFSDRDGNIAYDDPYQQRELDKQKIGAAYFVIDSKNDAYEVVTADANLLGKPKHLFSFMARAKYHFKDNKNIAYIGWIPKKNLLHYNHSFLYPNNNKPLKYRVGIQTAERLFDMSRYFSNDTLKIFTDPFLKDKTDDYVLLNQVVYPYKYDEIGKAVLISNQPTLQDTNNLILGWVPADLIFQTGQHQLLKTQSEPAWIPFTSKDTLPIKSYELENKHAYSYSGNSKTFTELPETASIPLQVWDHSKNKLINVKGENIFVSDIDRMKTENKNTNFHLIFFEKDKHLMSPFLNSLQSIWLRIPESQQSFYTFSASCVSQQGNSYLPPTQEFAVWLDYIDKTVSKGITPNQHSKTYNLQSAILKNINNGKGHFENNIFLIFGTDEHLKLQPSAISSIAKKSGKFLFVQMKSHIDTDYQNFVLEAKELLNNIDLQYMSYIENYIVENSLIKQGGFINLVSNEDNIYIFDAPTNSLTNGGIVFPRSNNRLANLSLDSALDSLITKVNKTNAMLISSLQKHQDKLGFLRSEPSNTLSLLLKKNQDTDSISISDIDRLSANEIFYTTSTTSDSIFSSDACLINKEEMKSLLQEYHSLLPEFANTITKKQARFVKKLYKSYVKDIKRAYKRKMLSRCKSSVADLFYYKTGFPVYNEYLTKVKIRKVARKKVLKNGFRAYYINAQNKLQTLEEMFQKNQLETVETPQDTYYLVPKDLLL